MLSKEILVFEISTVYTCGDILKDPFLKSTEGMMLIRVLFCDNIDMFVPPQATHLFNT